MQLAVKALLNAHKITKKQIIIAGVFTLALAGSIGLGLANRISTSAATVRDCSTNSIDYANYAGGCGAADAKELVADARHNSPSDLQNVYNRFGLKTADYDKFAAEAKQGTLFRDGHIEVAGQTVATGAWSMGREKFNGQRQPVEINGKTYYHSATNDSFASNVNSLPVMVWFAADGTVQTAIMNPCGNPITKYTSVKPSLVCKAIKSTQPDAAKKPNTYNFTAEATLGTNTKLSRVVYHFSDDNTSVTKTSLTDAVEHTFKKDGEVTVTVYATVPGGKEIQAAAVVNCKKAIKYVAPMYVCVNLVPSVINEQERSFRFTVKAKMDATTTLKDVNFEVDGKTDAGVTAKDGEGNIYKDYAFTDDKSHAIKATLNFTTADGVKSASCQASVTPNKTPMCLVPGKETLPVNHPDCGYCKPGVPVGSEECKPKEVLGETTLPNTGPGSLLGLATGVGMAGFAGHKLHLRRKLGKQ